MSEWSKFERDECLLSIRFFQPQRKAVALQDGCFLGGLLATDLFEVIPRD